MPGCGRQIILGNIYNGNSRWEIALRNLWETRHSWETKLKKILELNRALRRLWRGY